MAAGQDRTSFRTDTHICAYLRANNLRNSCYLFTLIVIMIVNECTLLERARGRCLPLHLHLNSTRRGHQGELGSQISSKYYVLPSLRSLRSILILFSFYFGLYQDSFTANTRCLSFQSLNRVKSQIKLCSSILI